ncbi:neuritin 1-like a [Syngnathoides biaculeatus]|uniref:neuritin 1-like a n=1 Tax=Syngnathoides biaculeatus TaxID=300417 RepID=UPI002ADD5A98|nr:neuritin 1-like a [Syngnathoides biaculeatus]
MSALCILSLIPDYRAAPNIGARNIVETRQLTLFEQNVGHLLRGCRTRFNIMNSVCFFVTVALILMLSPCSVAAVSTRRCHFIYKGFAQCLMALGDSLTDTAHKDEDTHEIHSICRSWDEFHDCANVAMAGCPEEAATVWESLRQESKKMQFSGNLYDMCSNRNSHTLTSGSSRGSHIQGELNQESLRGRVSCLAASYYFPMLLSSLLLLF